MTQQIGALFASSFSTQDSGSHLPYHENPVRHTLHHLHYNVPQTVATSAAGESGVSRGNDASSKTLRQMCDVQSNTFNGLKLPANYLKRLQDAGVLQLDRPLLSSGANSTVDDEEDDQLTSLDAVWKRYQTAESTIRQLEQAIFTEEDEYLRESLPIGNLLQGMQFTPDKLEKAKEIVKERQELSIREGYGPEVLVISPASDRLIDDNDRLFLLSCGPHALRTCAPLLRERHAEIEQAKQLQEDIEREEDIKRSRIRRSPVHFSNKGGQKSPTPVVQVLVPEDDISKTASIAGKRSGRTPVVSAADADDKKKKGSTTKHTSRTALDTGSSVSSGDDDVDVQTTSHEKTGDDSRGRTAKSSSRKPSPPAVPNAGKKGKRHAGGVTSPTPAKKRGRKPGGKNKPARDRSSGAKKEAKKNEGKTPASRRNREDSDDYDTDSDDDDEKTGSSSSSDDASSQSSAPSAKSERRTAAKQTASSAGVADVPKARRGRPRKNEVRPKKAAPAKTTTKPARPAAKAKKARTSGGGGGRGRGRPPKKQSAGTSRLSESESSEQNETLSDDDDDAGSSGSSTGSLSSSSD